MLGFVRFPLRVRNLSEMRGFFIYIILNYKFLKDLNMKSFFEYFYYRMFKLKGNNNSWEMPLLGLSVTQFMLIVNIVFLLIYGPLNIKGNLSGIEKGVLIILFFGLQFYNYKVYNPKIEQFDIKWGSENKRQKTIGMIKIILFIAFSWGFIFINAYIFDRYK